MPSDHAARLLDAFPVSAGAFVVTLYGDVGAPRGGRLWMGEIVETCAALGISGTRVRTAASRLSESGRIAGERIGRRSLYRLTESAEAEFARATRLIYAPPAPAPLSGWILIPLPAGPAREKMAARLGRARFGLAQPHLAILPDRGEPAPQVDAPVFRAASRDDLTELVSGAWPLEDLAARMRGFIDGFAPLSPADCAPEEALALRLLLVHIWRAIALTDPVLPPGLLPPDWPGAEARRLFARLYRGLSPAAERAAAARFTDLEGRPLVPSPEGLAARIGALGPA